jgi:hypothetical protein
MFVFMHLDRRMHLDVNHFFKRIIFLVKLTLATESIRKLLSPNFNVIKLGNQKFPMVNFQSPNQETKILKIYSQNFSHPIDNGN